MKKVAITGMGVVSPVGNSVQEFWSSLTNAQSGIGEIARFDTKDIKVKVAAEVKNFDATDILTPNDLRRNDLYASYACVAAHQAVVQSGIVGHVAPDRFGVYIGSGIGGINTLINNQNMLRDRGPSRVSPYLVPMMIPNIAAGMVAIKYNAQGVNVPIVSACASATHSIGEAFNAIRFGLADAIIAGGAEAPICELSVAGFANMKALSTNPDPKTACRPFDNDRDGFVMGEGAGILVLEEYEHARARGAKILGTIVGYSNNCDAYHVTSPRPDASAGARAIKQAIDMAGIKDSSSVYVNAHGTSTEFNDSSETAAIKLAFGEEQAKKLNISSTKSMHGHMLGAVGGVESIACVQALQDDILPPTINYTTVDPKCDLDYIPNQPRKKSVNFAVSNSLGFGGHNAVVVFGKV